MIVDVDTHWEGTRYPPGKHPLEPWLARVPGGLQLLADAMAGDLTASLAPERRPSAAELLPSIMARSRRDGGPPVLHPLYDSSASERIRWMDHVGIDQCLVNPGAYWTMLAYLGADRARAVPRCNDFLAEQLSDQPQRLHWTALVDFHDLDAAVAELERARRRGARAFFLYTEKGRPPGRVSLAHPDWDRVWSAATRLGMLAVIHIGNTVGNFDGWAEIGWDLPGGAGIPGLVRLANTQRIGVAQNLLASLLYGGVFARHPQLTVLLEEMRAGWLPWFVDMLDAQSRSSLSMGDWPWQESGGDMLRRAIRVTPLPGLGDRDALDVLERLPGMCVFSSDFPHQEGNAAPLELYRPRLDQLDPALRASFLGANIAACFERMGDPLPAAGRSGPNS